MAEFFLPVMNWLRRTEEVLQTHPRETLQYAIGALIVLLCLLLLLVRRIKNQAALIRRQSGELSRLARVLEQRHIPAQEPQPVTQRGVPEALPAPVLAEELLKGLGQLPEGEFPKDEAQESAPLAPQEESLASPFQVEGQLSRGLAKSRSGFLNRLAGFFAGRSSIDTTALDDLEELLILSDVGARCAADLVKEVKESAEKQGALAPAELTGLLKEGILRALLPTSNDHRLYKPTISPLVILVVGVNGVGKTTTVAKLATKYMQQGKKVLAIAADTFRAAAVEQLAEWSTRVGFALARGPEGAKPSAVVFDGMVQAQQGGFDVVLIDTAGRLHTKSNLMQELEGIRNVVKKHVPDGPHETILVLDGVSGQNALSQAREFNSAVTLSGLVVTKLDGTPKGGIIIAIAQELKVPVFFIGVGEKVGDLIPFDKKNFVEALFEDAGSAATDHPSGITAQVGNT